MRCCLRVGSAESARLSLRVRGEMRTVSGSFERLVLRRA